MLLLCATSHSQVKPFRSQPGRQATRQTKAVLEGSDYRNDVWSLGYSVVRRLDSRSVTTTAAAAAASAALTQESPLQQLLLLLLPPLQSVKAVAVSYVLGPTELSSIYLVTGERIALSHRGWAENHCRGVLAVVVYGSVDAGDGGGGGSSRD